MATISIGDLTGTAQLDIAETSLFGRNKLQSLLAPVSDFKAALSGTVADSAFHSASFGATFDNASLPLDGNLGEIKAGVNASLKLIGSSASPLFGADDYDPVTIAAGDLWMAFEIDTLIGVGASAPLPYGFGVCFKDTSAASFATYSFIAKASASSETLQAALQATLDNFNVAGSAKTILNIPEGVIWTSDVSGTIKVGGSWSLPLAVNQLSLADANLPFSQKVTVSPALTVKIGGDVVLTSEFSVRVHRAGEGKLRLGLFRKHGAGLDVCFTVSAGVTAGIDGMDLIDAFLSAVAPGVGRGGLNGSDLAKIQPVLKASIDRSLSISLNAACSASTADEAAIVYEIDTSLGSTGTVAAIDSALQGDWTALADLPNAVKIRHVILDTIERKYSLTVNLLGIYNYRSIEDFVSVLRILRNDEDGSVTLTDTATATQIATASTPLADAANRLRAALYEGFIATATYKALLSGAGADASFSAKQDLLIYRQTLGYRSALKDLNIGEALRVMPVTVKTGFPAAGAPVHQARFAATASYGNDAVLRFFFSDVAALTPRQIPELTRTGRRVLASLLDAQDVVDRKRIDVLTSDANWAAMDANPAQIQPPSYSDWYDITMWAKAIAHVAPLLASAIQSARAVGGDPSADPDFMKKRADLAKALDGATHKIKAAFEQGFPICVMAALSGGASPVTFQAGWDGKTVFG